MPQGVNLYKVDAEMNRIRVTDVAALLKEKNDKKEKEKVSVDENSLQFKEEGEKIIKEKTVTEKQTNVNTTEDSHNEKTPITNDREENEMNNGVGTKEDENFSEKSNNN